MAKQPSKDLPVDPSPDKLPSTNLLAPTALVQPTEPAPSGVPPQTLSGLNMASPVGQTIGDFEVLQELGRGGMGVVYKARQVSLDRPVALKMLLSEHFRNPTALARFLSEARAAAALDHPHIVRVYAVGDSEYGPYFAMEFIEGRTLEEHTFKEGQHQPVSIATAINVLIPVCEAVHYAHGRGIVHRDLKPSNIMLDRFKRPVVMDFGIAKQMGQTTGLTQEGVIVGTPAFMPPEQAGEEAGKIGPHSDVYALGAILYILLTGRPTYEASTTLQAVLKVISPEMPPSVRSLRADVPARLDQVVMKCLAKSPSGRVASAQALAEELRRLRSGLSKSNTSIVASGLPVLILVAEETGKPIRLIAPVTLIGRGADCDMVVKASDVSKQHCRILLQPGKAIVEDLDSVNGVQVNGEAVGQCELQDGDLLEIADHAFRIRLKL
jgi:serine/threonine protein kinase